MTHRLGHTVHERIRGGVLEALRLLVYIVPAETKVLYQIRFDNPMAPQDLECLAAPGARQPNTVVGFVFQKTIFGKSADHATHRSRLDIQNLGQLTGACGLTAFIEGIDSLQVVFDGARQASELHDAR